MKSPHKRGYRHPETGLLFWGIVSRGRELWLTEEKMENYKRKTLERSKKYIARKKEESGYYLQKRPKIGTLNPETGLVYYRMQGIKEIWVTPEKLKTIKERKQERARERKKADPEKYKAKYREYIEKNKDRERERCRLKMAKARAENKDNFKKIQLKKKNDRCRERVKTDPVFAMKMRALFSLNRAFKQKGFSKSGNSRELLGCSWEELKVHIEVQFRDGMSWENKGQWHIDHIIPLSSAKTVEEVKALCHHQNLQPLWALDNIKKGAKVYE